MEYIIILALFLPIVYLAARQKKWYLFLLFGFMGVLPEQFSFEIHEKLPLITVTRLLIVLVCGFWAYNKLKTKKFNLPVSILAFLGVNILVSLINLRFGFDEVNRMFLYVFERALVMIMALDLVENKEEFETSVDFVILGSVAMALIGIMQTVFAFDAAEPLHITETITSISLTHRMGLTRAFATTNAISYGCYIAFVSPLMLYKLSQTHKHRYSVALALNLVALICTFSRSAWLCLIGVFGLIFLVRPKKFIKEAWVSVVLVLVLCLGLSLVQVKFGNALVETAKSSVNTVLDALPDSWFAEPETPDTPSQPDPEPEPDDPDESSKPQTPSKPQKPSFELSEEFGLNGDDPTYSRVMQWTAVKRMAMDGDLLLGYGYNGFAEGKAYFFRADWDSKWYVAKMMDVGFVALFVESGLVGFLAYIGLLGYIAVVSFKKRKSVEGFNFYKMSIFVVMSLVALNIMAAMMFDQIVWIYFALFYAYDKLHKEGKLKSESEPVAKWSF